MNLIPKLALKYPENSIGGQCGIFAHKLIEFDSVGDSYASKKRAVQNRGILVSNLHGDFRVGDVCITSEGTFMGIGAGHVAVAARVVDGQPYAAESNFRNDGRVHYGRAIPINKIYGVIRGKFLIDLKLPPLVLNTTILMQYEKQWNSSIFKELSDKFFSLTGIILNIKPVYTYKALKNWWYTIAPFEGAEYKIIDWNYIKEQAIPITYGDSQIILWSINLKEWEGSVVTSNGQFQECGYQYYGTKPCFATIACEEKTMSLFNSEKAFIDYGLHEIFHALYYWGRGDYMDYCHNHFFGLNGQPKDMSKCINDLDINHLAVNLLP